MPKYLGLAIAAGLASAVLFVSVFTGSATLLLTTYMAPLPLFAAGLGLGLPAAVVAGGVALVAVVAATGGAAALPFAATTVAPALVVVRQALLWRTDAGGKAEWYPPGLLLGWLTGLAAVVLAVAALLAPPHDGGVAGLVRSYLEQVTGAMLPEADASIRELLVEMWAPLLPGLLATVWLLVAALNGVLAQWGLRRAGRNLRPTPSYQALELPPWLAAALLAAVIASFVAGGDFSYVAQNVAVLLLVPYVLLGLAGVHGALRQRPHGGMLLALFYGLFFVVFGWAVLIVAGLGFVRHWTTLRRHFAGGSQEEE